MSNSITDSLTIDYFLNRIQFLLNSSPNIVYCIVEGKTDKKFFSKLLTKNVIYDDCVFIDECKKIKEVFGEGKGKIERLINLYYNRKQEHDKYNNDKYRLIGIRDRDYSTIRHNEGIFFCDYCCLEMMIISDDNCFNNLCSEYYSGDEDYLSIRFSILKHLENLSKLRQCNERNDLKINFGSGGIKCTVFNEDEKLMNENIINTLKGFNCNNSHINNKEIETYYCKCSSCQKCENEQELFDITNGHDFISMCVAKFSKCKNHNGNISVDRIESALRISFCKVNFSKTKLYSDLKEYQSKFSLRIVE